MHGLAVPRPSLRRVRVVAFVLGFGIPGVLRAQPTSDDGVVRFTYPDSTATDVHLAGDFNGWSQTATPLDREGAGWNTRVFLDAGVYEYKFFVDGNWQLDPANPEISSQGNSVVRVGPDGGVLPPRATSTPLGGAASAGGANVGWSIRYLGYVTSRREPALDRYDLDRPLHDVDLRLDARITPELSGGFIANLTNRGPGESESQLSLRYDRGGIEWTPGTSKLSLFDNLQVTTFDDPGALVGRIGIYADQFGYGRRGIDWRQRILGAPLEILYADDTEPGPSGRLDLELPGLPAAPDAGAQLERYATSASHRGADALAVRLRAGTDDQGVGVSWRLDRGARRGGLVDLAITSASNDTLTASGDLYETAERWNAWGIEARGRWRDARLAAEYLAGSRRAEATTVSVLDVTSIGGVVDAQRGDPLSSDRRFDLDHSRRVVVIARSTRDPRTATWSARPGSGALDGPRIEYAYEEHDYSSRIAGEPFLMRAHSVSAGIDGRWADIQMRFDVEQHWFRYPQAATWETQFWFRRQNAWLDEDVTRVDRMTLLGVRSPFVARLHAHRLLWASRALTGELHLAYAAPGIDHAPRYFEGILRLALPLRERLALRTHSRLAVYRQFETQDPGVVAALGPGRHFEAGDLPFAGGAPIESSYRALSAHFVELVYAVTSRSDIALGFGVDPFVVYEVTNAFEPIGWDQFLFANGASPGDALAHPVDLGRQLENAERALERERRLVVEARLRF